MGEDIDPGQTILPLTEREHNVYMAKLAEQAERYDEMASYIARPLIDPPMLEAHPRDRAVNGIV